MKMMLVTYRRSLDEGLRRLLKELDLKAFAEAPKILGIGAAADAGFSMAWPGHCAIILSALRDDEAEQLLGILREFRDRLSDLQGGGTIPMKVFVFPCEQVL